jgi:hypothetical protein
MYSDQIYPESRLVISRFSGTVGITEIRHWIDQLVARPDFARDFNGTIDFRDAQLDLSFDALREIAKQVSSCQLSGRWAHLVTTPVETAISFSYREISCGDHPLDFFSTLRGASAYLGCDLLQFLPDDNLI